MEAAKAIRLIKKKIKIPLVADIHFDYRLALCAIENGADKVRLNPGNIHKKEDIKKVVVAAKRRKIPIRVGANSGSLRDKIQATSLDFVPRQARDFVPRQTRDFARDKRDKEKRMVESMVKSVLDYIKVLERMDFYDIIVSLKASDVTSTVEAYKLFSKRSSYPLHLGITAAGPASTGIIKSSIGIGALLLDGIGDTIRVSLTGNPEDEVIAAKNILQALNLRNFWPEIISCPTCGRCQVDLQSITENVVSGIRSQAAGKNKNSMLKIAIMGCEVNGPGEAKEADIGIACGKGSGVIFKKGKIVKRVEEKDIVKEILKNI